MKNCYIYARTATTEVAARGNSIVGQINICLEYANKRKLAIKGTHSDCGSGMTLNRVGFKSLLKDLIDNPSCYLLVTKYDRITRKNLASTMQLLKDVGVNVLSVQQGSGI